MDFVTIMTDVAAAFFWGLVIAEMMLATAAFCGSNVDYDTLVQQHGVTKANGELWLYGILSSGMPVLQAGQWLHGSEIFGWGLVFSTLVVWFFLFLPIWLDR